MEAEGEHAVAPVAAPEAASAVAPKATAALAATSVDAVPQAPTAEELEAARRAEEEARAAAERAAVKRAARAARRAAMTGATPEQIVSAARDATANDGGAGAGDDAEDKEDADAAAVVRSAQLESAGRDEAADVVRRIVSMRAEREGAAAADAVDAAERAVAKLDAALSQGTPMAEAMTLAISRSLDESAVVAVAVERVTSEHGDAAGVDAVAAAADAACMLNSSGAEAHVAITAGERAAVGVVVHHETLEAVHESAGEMAEICASRGAAAADDVAPVVVPGWSLEGWLHSLPLEGVVVGAARKRLDETVSERATSMGGEARRKLERAYVEHLGRNGSVEMVLALLKESPVLYDLAQAIYDARASSPR